MMGKRGDNDRKNTDNDRQEEIELRDETNKYQRNMSTFDLHNLKEN